MTLENETSIEYAHAQLKKFFPTIDINTQELEQKISDKSILLDSELILPYVQSALFDEKIVEMHLDNSRETYLATLRDFPPVDDDQPEEVSVNIVNVDDSDSEVDEDAYNYGDYLKSCKQIVSLPVEPGMGNINLRRSSRVTLRLYTTNKTIELGVCFDSIVTVEDVPLLSLSFPTIARVIEEDREFRARVPQTFNLSFHISGTPKWTKFETTLKDISPKGLGFIVPREFYKAFALGDKVKGSLELAQDGKNSTISVLGEVKHITCMRTNMGREYICGLFLHFSSTIDSSKVERLVAQTQRAHMREIMAKSDTYGVHLMI